jgi:hypothetical protein
MDTTSLVGVSEAARQLGVHKSTISRQVAAGIIPNHGTDAQPLVDVEEAKRARAEGLDRSKQRGQDAPLFRERRSPDDDDAGEASPGYQAARTEREQINARRARLELERELGNLLDKGEVVDAFFTLGARLRELTENAAAELTQRFGPELGAALREELRRMLVAIAEDFERRFAGPGESADAA